MTAIETFPALPFWNCKHKIFTFRNPEMRDKYLTEMTQFFICGEKDKYFKTRKEFIANHKMN